MPSFDVHQHLWPPQVVETLRGRRKRPRLDGDVLDLNEGQFSLDLGLHDLDERLALLDRDAVDVAVVSLQPTLDLDAAPDLADAYHDGIVDMVSASGGRLRTFAAGRCLPGFAGACVPAAAVVAGLGDLPDELERAGQPLFVHPGPPRLVPPGAPPWWSAVVDYSAQMQAAHAAWVAGGAERHPGLVVIFAVLAGGAPIQLERFQSRGVEVQSIVDASVYFETSSYGRRALELTLDTFGVDRVLYGSDIPAVDSQPTLRALEELGETVKRAVRIENPTRLFA
jgi:6-methylsalicylate decarboxylase